MKIAIKRVLTADLDAVVLTIESKTFNLIDVLAVMKNASIISSSATDLEYTIYLETPFVVQAVSGSTNISMQTIDDSDLVEITNIVPTTLSQFINGSNYLLLGTEVSLVPIIPTVPAIPVTSNIGAVTVAPLSARRYHYIATSTHNPLGATTFDAITFNVNYEAMKVNAMRKQQRKATNFA